MPDVCVTVGRPGTPVIQAPPLIVIGILARHDQPADLLQKVAEYQAFGVPHIWVIDPWHKRAFQYGKGNLEQVETALNADTVEVPREAAFDGLWPSAVGFATLTAIRTPIPLLMLACGLVSAQQPAIAPKFEVFSIKPCTTAPRGGFDGRETAGRLHLECFTLDSLIHDAYLTFPDGKPLPTNGLMMPPVPYWQWRQDIKGSTGWIKSDRFTIDAKADGPAIGAMMRGPMMQQVLKDRFKLLIHREPRPVAAYELTVAKGAPKFQPAAEGSCLVLTPDKPPPTRQPGQDAPRPICGGTRVSPTGGVDLAGVSMAFLCWRLSVVMGRDVIDQTGLTGIYNVHLNLTMNDLLISPRSPSVTSNNPVPEASEPTGNIPSALRKVGLQLQPAKITADFLVIDHAEKPSAN